MDDGMRYARLAEKRSPRDYLLVLYPSPLPGNFWGALAPLRGTSWGAEISEVPGDALSHALHGHLMPLRRVLGIPPQIRPRRLPVVQTMCLEKQSGRCPVGTGDCMPGSTRLPECYVAPSEDETLRRLGTLVGRAWDEGRYVFVVNGQEHNVR